MVAKPEKRETFDVEHALRRAERARDLFVSVLGHDLRNPLNTIVLGCNLLASSALEPKRRSTVERMMSASQRIETIIRNALFVAQALKGGVTLERARVDLAPICLDLVEELRRRHPDFQLVHVGDEHSVGTWDSDRLSQAIENLLSNALKYGDGAASLELKDAPDHALISVHNNGQSIPQEAFSTLFDPLRRSDERSGGVGLGLFIVEQIVSAHGGHVELRSTETEGTTFSLWLPKNH